MHFDNKSVVDGSEFFKLASMYALMARCFPIWHFFGVALSELRRIFALGPSSSPYIITIFPSCLSIRLFSYDPCVPIFYSQIVLLPLHLVVVMSSYILLLLVLKIFFRCFKNAMFCLYYFILSRYLLRLLLYRVPFLFIFTSRTVYFACFVALLLSSLHVPAFVFVFFSVLAFLLVVVHFYLFPV